MFQKIHGINIGQGPGNAFGAGIYSANAEIGFSNGPTKVTLNVVSENGHYQSVVPNVTTTPYNIDINGKVFSGMYLSAYEKHKSAGVATMTLSFLDYSIVLDKIYIGLLNRHGIKDRQTNLVRGAFSVRCPSCFDGAMGNVAGLAVRYLDALPKGHYFERASDGGGYIILGEESFTESNCDLAKVDYNFTEFCAALTAFGIHHELATFDLNPLYRQEYAGSLREVLNNWASDFSFEFFFENHVLKGIDLRRPISLSTVQTFAENNEFVTEMTFSETLDNTYTQTLVARYLKPSTAAEYNNTFNFKQLAYPITLPQILSDNGCAHRKGAMLEQCAALARLDGALREIFIANWAVENNDYSVLEALGMRTDVGLGLPTVVEGVAKEQILHAVQELADEQRKDNVHSVGADFYNINNWLVLAGVLHENLKSEIEAWDREAANFIGKYYRFVTRPLPKNTFECPYNVRDWFVYWTFNSQWSTMPQSQNYGANSVPFSQLMRDPATNTALVGFFVDNMFEVNDNTWGIEQSTYDAQRGDFSYEVYRPRFIKWDDFPAPEYMWLKNLQQSTPVAPPGTVAAIINAADQSAKTLKGEVCFLAIPLASKMAGLPKISQVAYSTPNRAVYERVVTRNQNDTKGPHCQTYCDSSIVRELCNCGSEFEPVPYFQSLLAPFFLITHTSGATSQVIFPVQSNYFGYFVHQRAFKTTYPPVKQVYGKPTSTSSNTLANRVIDYDITPDLESVADNTTDAINQYIYSPTTKAIMSAQEYIQGLTNLTNLVIPPQKTLGVTVARTDLKSLGIPLSPAGGLTAMSISLADGGVQTQLSYATRPPVVPKPEAIFAKIKYRLKGR